VAAGVAAAAGLLAGRTGLGVAGLLAEAGAQAARTAGWLEGRRRRAAVRERRRRAAHATARAAGTPGAAPEGGPG
jgi:hypothetical protein